MQPAPHEIETITSATYKARLIGDFIVEQRSSHVQSLPFFVGLQGPQGCGKTTLMDALQEYLTSTPSKLRTAVLSLDDLYLDHPDLVSLAVSHPNNTLLSGRGQPGTHDIALALKVMNQLISDKQSSESHVELPVFDKSLHGGQGGRSTQTVKIEPPIDVFILEGWSVGFEPLSDTVLEDLYAQALEGNRNVRQGTSTSTKYMASHDLQSLKQVNQFLRDFSTQIWPLFSSIITIRPTNYEYVFEWRLQQELALRQRSEGRGMSDEGVRLFVARYMPGYELWADQIKRSPRWENRGLEMVYGSGRELLELHTF